MSTDSKFSFNVKGVTNSGNKAKFVDKFKSMMLFLKTMLLGGAKKAQPASTDPVIRRTTKMEIASKQSITTAAEPVDQDGSSSIPESLQPAAEPVDQDGSSSIPESLQPAVEPVDQDGSSSIPESLQPAAEQSEPSALSFKARASIVESSLKNGPKNPVELRARDTARRHEERLKQLVHSQSAPSLLAPSKSSISITPGVIPPPPPPPPPRGEAHSGVRKTWDKVDTSGVSSRNPNASTMSAKAYINNIESSQKSIMEEISKQLAGNKAFQERRQRIQGSELDD
ncbi:hypothetical protein RF663_09465 [Aeromonas veronii]|uniref:hypothetical protein n=1 Tax=Aeromonas veronii TaxID=654 RepID=UPI0028531ED3|nr:hypothetical protein [Aeromonas veronii]MDR5014452.1 hypothetical protein [Aeromonas veronii]